jgi:hypothetical protein
MRDRIARLQAENTAIDDKNPPHSYQDVMSREDSEPWEKAYHDEFQGLVNQKVLEIVEPPLGHSK